MGNQSSLPVRVAEVLIDSVGLSRIFSYRIPDKMQADIGVGSYVSVKLANSRSKGWVVGLKELSVDEAESLPYELLPVSRLLGGGPTPEVVSLCKWAAWRFVGSPVNFLTHASPKRRISPTPGGELDFHSCEEKFFHSRGDSLVVRIPPTHSRVCWVIEHLGDPAELVGTAIVVCASQALVKQFARQLAENGYRVAIFPDHFEDAVNNAHVVVGARNAVFASVSRLSEVIVVDADDPSHTESSSPSWSSYIVAQARVGEGQKAVLLSSAPTLDMLYGSKTMSLSRRVERSGWPKIRIGNISEPSRGGPLISGDLLGVITSVLRTKTIPPTFTNEGLIDYDGVIVLYNRLGGARTLVCQRCNQVVSCEVCSTTLMQAISSQQSAVWQDRGEMNRMVKERLALFALTCPRCKKEYPVICTHCMSTSLKVVTFGIDRFKDLLQAALGTPVGEIRANSEVRLADLPSVIIGTEAVFSRFTSAKLVVVADFDHYLYAPSLDAREKAFALVARAARLVPSRSVDTGNVPIYLQTRDVDSPVIRAVVAGDPRLLTSKEAAMRRRLGLPPFGAIVRCYGPKAQEWISRSDIAGALEIEVISVRDGVFDIRSGSLDRLLDSLSELRSKLSFSGVHFSAIPA